MRTAFERNEPAAALHRFATILNSPQGRQEIACVLLMNGSLLRFHPDTAVFKLQKENIFLGSERIRAVLMKDQSALTVSGGKIMSIALDDLKRFIHAPATPEKDPVKPEPEAVLPKSKKSEAELRLFSQIVDEFDGNAFAQYLKENRTSLLRFASRNEFIAEEALQEVAISVLGMMRRKAAGEENGFCKTSMYFDTWLRSVLRNKASNIGTRERNRSMLRLSTQGEDDEDSIGAVHEETLQADLDPGVLSYHGHEDPLAFFERNERQADVVEVLSSLFDRARTEPRMEMLIRASVKKSGLQSEFAGEVIPSDYENLAKEARIPVGTVRSRISRARKDARLVAARMRFMQATWADAASDFDEGVIPDAHLVPKPG